MLEALLLILGLALGAAAGYALGLLRARRSDAAEAARLSSENAAHAATLGEVRGQLAGRDAELAAARDAAAAELKALRHAKDTELAALRDELERQRIRVGENDARMEAARQHFAEQRRSIEEMDKRVRDTFTALSAEALKSNNQQFMTLADEKLTPLREQLARYEMQIKELEKARSEAYGGLAKHLTRLEEGRESLSRETRQLVSALRQPGTKGKWGEVGLKNLIEKLGMSSFCDFIEQGTLSAGDAGRQRPDLVVRLPGERWLAIDSKVNASAYLDATQCADEAEKTRHLKKYASDVAATMKALAAKEYWSRLDHSPEFVVMYMPGEAFFAAAVEAEPDLLADGIDRRVLLASPTTLAALLMAVRYGWQQQQVAENAERIASAGRDLYDRLVKFTEHLDGVRLGIERAAKAYDQAVGNWQMRTEPAARRLKELDAAATGSEIKELQVAEVHMRPLLTSEADEPELPELPAASTADLPALRTTQPPSKNTATPF